MDFHSPLSNEGVGVFVSRVDPSSAAIGQREEVRETQGDLYISLCIQCSKLSTSLSLRQSPRHAQGTGYRRLELGFVQ